MGQSAGVHDGETWEVSNPRLSFAHRRSDLLRFACPPCLSRLTTEGTEHLSDLGVEALLATEDAEAVLTGGEIFARSEDTQP